MAQNQINRKARRHTTDDKGRRHVNRRCAVKGCKNVSSWLPMLTYHPSTFVDVLLEASVNKRAPLKQFVPQACVCNHHRARIERDYGPTFFVNPQSWGAACGLAHARGYPPPSKDHLEVRFVAIKPDEVVDVGHG